MKLFLLPTSFTHSSDLFFFNLLRHNFPYLLNFLSALVLRVISVTYFYNHEYSS